MLQICSINPLCKKKLPKQTHNWSHQSSEENGKKFIFILVLVLDAMLSKTCIMLACKHHRRKWPHGVCVYQFNVWKLLVNTLICADILVVACAYSSSHAEWCSTRLLAGCWGIACHPSWRLRCRLRENGATSWYFRFCYWTRRRNLWAIVIFFNVIMVTSISDKLKCLSIWKF